MNDFIKVLDFFKISLGKSMGNLNTGRKNAINIQFYLQIFLLAIANRDLF